MKRAIIVLVMFCTSIIFAQEQNSKVTLEKNGNVVEATYFDTSGSIDQHGFFKNNKRHGNWIRFNEKGKKIVVGYYENGKKTGKWVFRIGETLKEVDYVDNKIISVNEWSNKSSILVSN